MYSLEEREELSFRPLSGFLFSNEKEELYLYRHSESFRPLSGFLFSNVILYLLEKKNIVLVFPSPIGVFIF